MNYVNDDSYEGHWLDDRRQGRGASSSALRPRRTGGGASGLVWVRRTDTELVRRAGAWAGCFARAPAAAAAE